MSRSRRTTYLALALLMSGLILALSADAQDDQKTKAEDGETAKIVPSGFLGDYSDLVPDADKKNLLVYRKGDRSIVRYRRFLVERPLIYFHPEARGVGVDPRDLAMLSEFLHDQLKSALSDQDGYEIVDEPGEGVLLLRVAITDVVPIDPAKNVGTKAAGMAFGVGLLIPRVDLGSASVEAEFLDSESGERLVAVVATKDAKRFGGVIKGSKEWGDAKAAFKKWAKMLRKRLDQAHEM